ncbi:hypothetical protein LTR08_003119 [Meristemomyces frigidus]|nr:hypothetical protein LTR08_003119 [Meristemomyces frigidus]
MSDAVSPSPSIRRSPSRFSSLAPSVNGDIHAPTGTAQDKGSDGTPTPAPATGEGTTTASGGDSLLDRARLLEKYGSLYAVDEEQARRKFQRRRQFEKFELEAKEHQMRAEYLGTMSRIWKESRAKNDAEIEKCKARIEELEGQNEARQVAEANFNEQFGADVVGQVEDQEKRKKWEAYFALETDELNL